MAKKKKQKKTGTHAGTEVDAAPREDSSPAPSKFGVPAWTFLAMLAATAIAGIWIARVNGLLAWIMTLALMLGLLVAAGYNIKKLYFGCLIDDRNRFSLSRVQLLCWTLLLLSAFFAAVFINLHAGVADPLAIDIPKELWILMGISTTSLVGSPLLLSQKAEEGQLDVKVDPKLARWSDLFKGESVRNEAYLDVSRIQMFYFTLVLLLAYGYAIAKLFLPFAGGADVEMGIDGLPPIQGGMLALLGISHTAYLGGKALPNKAPAS